MMAMFIRSALVIDFVLHVELRAATHDALRVGVSKFGRRGTEALASAINLHTLNLLSAGRARLLSADPRLPHTLLLFYSSTRTVLYKSYMCGHLYRTH